jgi:peptidyl-prolyl cis-trans isomerase C
LKLEKFFKVSVSDDEVNKFLDENKARMETVRARHILIKFEPTDDAAKKALKKEKAEKLRKQIVDGADFAKLAQENSDCRSKEDGGELIPPFRRGQMMKPFEDMAFRLKPNEISPVVETDYGYHIIQTLEINTPSKRQILAFLKNKQIGKQYEPMVTSLREKAKIEYLNGATPPPPPPKMMLPPMEPATTSPATGKPEPKPEPALEPKPEKPPEVKTEPEVITN